MQSDDIYLKYRLISHFNNDFYFDIEFLDSKNKKIYYGNSRVLILSIRTYSAITEEKYWLNLTGLSFKLIKIDRKTLQKYINLSLNQEKEYRTFFFKELIFTLSLDEYFI